MSDGVTHMNEARQSWATGDPLPEMGWMVGEPLTPAQFEWVRRARLTDVQRLSLLRSAGAVQPDGAPSEPTIEVMRNGLIEAVAGMLYGKGIRKHVKNGGSYEACHLAATEAVSQFENALRRSPGGGQR